MTSIKTDNCADYDTYNKKGFNGTRLNPYKKEINKPRTMTLRQTLINYKGHSPHKKNSIVKLNRNSLFLVPIISYYSLYTSNLIVYIRRRPTKCLYHLLLYPFIYTFIVLLFLLCEGELFIKSQRNISYRISIFLINSLN